MPLVNDGLNLVNFRSWPEVEVTARHYQRRIGSGLSLKAAIAVNGVESYRGLRAPA